jgi:carboxyl-terminal processing protease
MRHPALARYVRLVGRLALVTVPLVAGGFIWQSAATHDGSRVFDQVVTLVSERFVDTLDSGALYEKAAQGLVRELNDPYTELLPPKRLTEFSRRTGGRYGGVGMEIADVGGSIVVNRVFPHTPAGESGVLEGDRIIAIDTASTRGWKVAQISENLVGTPGTKVTVKFARPGVAEPIVFHFTRAIIQVPAVPFQIMLNGKIGYIPLQQFNESAAEDVAAALQKLEDQGAKGIILDLRDDPGGILDQALAVSNLFLRQGQEIASVRGRNTPPQVYTAKERPVLPTVPLVVMVNGMSASASEIVAGALQDHDRALIVGTTSFGKGLVQTLFPLDGGYALKMTTAKWYTPSGRSIQKERKLLPDGELVEVHPDSLENTPTGQATPKTRKITIDGSSVLAARSDSVETDSARRARPTFKSDAGRLVYGGGAITPDVIVKPETLSTREQNFFAKAVGPKTQQFAQVLSNLALDLKPAVRPDFTVQPAWRDDLYARLQSVGIAIPRAQYDSVTPTIDHLIADRVTRVAFGDSALKRRQLPDDVQLRRALELIERGQSQHDLFVEAQQMAAAQP